MGGCQRDPGGLIPFVEGQAMPGRAPGDQVDRQPTPPLGGHTGAELGPAAGEQVGQGRSEARPADRASGHGNSSSPASVEQRVERAHVTDPGEYHGRAEEGGEAVRVRPATAAGPGTGPAGRPG